MIPRSCRTALLSALLLLAAPPVLAQTPLPNACDMLAALPPATLPADVASFDLSQDRQTDAMKMSLCLANDTDGLSAASLLVRQDFSGTATPPAATQQRATMLAELTETFGQPPEAQLLDIGDAAVWVADIKQLMVWYRQGGVMLIVTAGGKDGASVAQDIARAIVARFP